MPAYFFYVQETKNAVVKSCSAKAEDAVIILYANPSATAAATGQQQQQQQQLYIKFQFTAHIS